jgi:hypothetical protein
MATRKEYGEIMTSADKRTLWLRWVVANAFGELIGLGATFAVIAWFPGITRRAWWFATLVGALAAYGLGYLPSTLMNLGEQATATPVTEPPQWIVLLLAAGLGGVSGAVLSFAQWRVMRKQVGHAAPVL